MKSISLSFGILWAGIVLSACAPQSSTHSGNAATQSDAPKIHQIAVVDAPAIELKSTSEIPGVLQRLQRMHATVSRQIQANEVEFFSLSELGEAYITAKRSKALTIGVPREQCPRYEAVYDAENLDIAVSTSFRGCVAYLEQAGNGAAECGCQLVAVNDVLLVKPQDLPYRDRVQTHLVYRQGRRGPLSRMVGVGEIPDGHSDTPISITNVQGAEVCSGGLTETTPGKGSAKLNCPGIGDNLVGKYEIEGLRDGREYGVALASSGDTVAALIFGYSENQYQEARERILKELLTQ